MPSTDLATREDIELELARRQAGQEIERRKAEEHPWELAQHVECIDGKTGERFRFDYANERGWGWQRDVIDFWLKHKRSLILKARQLGITWAACLLALWFLVTKPGTRVLAVSINQDEATKLVERVWDMYLSLPEHLKFGTTVISPSRGRPYKEMELEHPDGRVSKILALASSPSAGHGETAALTILDEFARQEYAAATWKAVVPTGADETASGGTGIVAGISTANGTSNPLTGGGNRFHHLYVNAKVYRLATMFLNWRKHPGRDQTWYDELGLPEEDRAEQYPDNAEEAFLTSGRRYYDKAALLWYSRNAKRAPLYLARFTGPKTAAKARLDKRDETYDENDPGPIIGVLEEPIKGHAYAIFADVATGSGNDFSAAYVIDLSNMTFCAELHGKLDEDLYAYQLHFLGRWFNDARIAVETQGGYGNTVITLLRDGKDGRPPYTKLYRHRESVRTDTKMRRNYGFPMNSATRPLIINGLGKALREHSLPFVTEGLMMELNSFVHQDTRPSPRAEDGTNDDRVIAAGGVLEMYRLFGAHAPPEARRRGPRPKRKKLYPWL